jgi:hypothetical protein
MKKQKVSELYHPLLNFRRHGGRHLVHHHDDHGGRQPDDSECKDPTITTATGCSHQVPDLLDQYLQNYAHDDDDDR